MVKDLCYFADAIFDGISRERNITDRRAEQMKTGDGGAWNSSDQGINCIDFRRDVISAPDGRFGGVEVEAE